MNLSQPPTAATWLLKFLTPRRKSEALLGDLQEEFAQRRSAIWYWREVLAAIFVSFAHELRLRSLGVGFPALWTAVALPFLRRIYTGPLIRHLFDPFFGWATRFDFPASVIYVATFTLLVLSSVETMVEVVGLGIYLLGTRNCTVHRFVRAASVALAVVFTGNIFVAAFLMFAVPAHLSRFFGYMLGAISLFVSLLVAVWTPSAENAGAKSISDSQN